VNIPSLNEFVTATEGFCGFAESDGEPLDGDSWRIRDLLLRLIYHMPAIDAISDSQKDLDGIWHCHWNAAL